MDGQSHPRCPLVPSLSSNSFLGGVEKKEEGSRRRHDHHTSSSLLLYLPYYVFITIANVVLEVVLTRRRNMIAF